MIIEKTMNNFIDTLLHQFGDTETQAIAQRVGSDTEQVQSVLRQFLPLVTKGLAHNASHASGQRALFSALSSDHDGSILANVESAFTDSNASVGSKILGHVFGSKIGPITQFLGKTSGMESSNVSQILQLAMPLVMGVLGKQTRSKGFNAGTLANMLIESTQDVSRTDPKNMNLIGRLLDHDGDGNVADDVASMGMGFLKNWMSGRRI